MARAAFWTMDTGRAQELAVTASESAPDDPGLRLRCEAQRCTALSVREDRTVDGLRESELVLAAWPADGPPAELANFLAGVAAAHYWVGDYARGVQRGRDGYRLARGAHHVDATLLTASALGLSLIGAGDHESALGLYAEATALGREHELVPRFTARLVCMWGGALRELGDTAAARERATEAIELARAARFPFTQLQSRIDLLCCDLLDGHVGAAQRNWPDLQEATAIRGWHNWLTLGRLAVARAEIALAAGDAPAAVHAAAQAEAYARRTHRRKYVAAAQHARGRALLALGRVEQAVTVLGEAVDTAEALGHPPTRWQAESSLAHALAAAGRDDADRAARDARDAFAATLTGPHRALLLHSPAADVRGA